MTVCDLITIMNFFDGLFFSQRCSSRMLPLKPFALHAQTTFFCTLSFHAFWQAQACPRAMTGCWNTASRARWAWCASPRQLALQKNCLVLRSPKFTMCTCLEYVLFESFVRRFWTTVFENLSFYCRHMFVVDCSHQAAHALVHIQAPVNVLYLAVIRLLVWLA